MQKMKSRSPFFAKLQVREDPKKIAGFKTQISEAMTKFQVRVRRGQKSFEFK
jgi:hypothetical protein